MSERHRGQPAFEPTEQQKKMVEALVGYGIPQVEICNLILNPYSNKPISPPTLRRAFRREIDQGDIKVKAIVGQFMIATILGRNLPEDFDGKPINDERARARLLELFCKARLKWDETINMKHDGVKDGAPFVFKITNAESKL